MRIFKMLKNFWIDSFGQPSNLIASVEKSGNHDSGCRQGKSFCSNSTKRFANNPTILKPKRIQNAFGFKKQITFWTVLVGTLLVPTYSHSQAFLNRIGDLPYIIGEGNGTVRIHNPDSNHIWTVYVVQHPTITAFQNFNSTAALGQLASLNAPYAFTTTAGRSQLTSVFLGSREDQLLQNPQDKKIVDGLYTAFLVTGAHLGQKLPPSCPALPIASLDALDWVDRVSTQLSGCLSLQDSLYFFSSLANVTYGAKRFAEAVDPSKVGASAVDELLLYNEGVSAVQSASNSLSNILGTYDRIAKKVLPSIIDADYLLKFFGLNKATASLRMYIGGLTVTTIADIFQGAYKLATSQPELIPVHFAMWKGNPVSVSEYLKLRANTQQDNLYVSSYKIDSVSSVAKFNLHATGVDSLGNALPANTPVIWTWNGTTTNSTLGSDVQTKFVSSGVYDITAKVTNAKISHHYLNVTVSPKITYDLSWLASKSVPGQVFLAIGQLNIPKSQIKSISLSFGDGTAPSVYGGTSGNPIPSVILWTHNYPVSTQPKTFKANFFVQAMDGRITQHTRNVLIMPQPNQLPIQPPSVSRISPHFSTEVAQNSTMKFRISSVDGDENMNKIEWLIDNSVKASHPLANQGFSMTKAQRLTFNQPGQHAVTARVTDATGKSDSVRWTVNVLPSNVPIVVSTTPAYSVGQTSGAIPVSTPVSAMTTFNASFNDVDRDLKKVYWLIDGETVWTNTVGVYPYPTLYRHRFNIGGDYTVSVIAKDSLGNQARVDWAVRVGSNLLGNHAPTVKILPPQHSGNGAIQYHVGQFYSFRYDAYDVDTTASLNLAYGEVNIDGKTNWYGARTNFSHILHGSADNFGVASGLVFSTPGQHTINVLVRDGAGLTGTNSMVVNVLPADMNSSTPPVIQSVYPAPAKIYYVKTGGSFSGWGLIYDAEADIGVTGRVEWWVDGVYKQASPFGDYPSDKFTFTLNRLGVGSHTVELRPFDDAGNQGQSVIYHVIGVAALPNIAPTATAILPALQSLTIAAGTRLRFKILIEDVDGDLMGTAKVQWSGCGITNGSRTVWGGYAQDKTFPETPLTSGVLTATVIDNNGNVSNAISWNITIGTPSTGNKPQIVNPTWPSGTHFRVLGKTSTIGLGLGFTVNDIDGDLARVESYVDGILIRPTTIGNLEGFSQNFDGPGTPLYFGSSPLLPRGTSGTIEIRAIDKAGNIASHKATYTSGYNRPPVVTASVPVTMAEDSVFSDVISAMDPDGDKVTFSIAGLPLQGDAKITNGNKLTYTPAVNYFGADTITIAYSDGFGGTGNIVYHVTVTSVNDIPILKKQGVQLQVTPGQVVPMNGILSNLAQDVETPAANLVDKAVLVPTGWVVSKPTIDPATWSFTVPSTYASGQKTLSQFVVTDTNGGESLPYSVEFAGKVIADLSITKTDGKINVIQGSAEIYTIIATNNGPDSVAGAIVSDPVPASLTGAAWTCVASTGSSCTASGTGNITDTTVNLINGGTATYTLTASLSAAATGPLVNTATITAPVGVTDPNPSNNSATDTDTIAAPNQPPVLALNTGINTPEDTPIVIPNMVLKTTDADNTPVQLTYTLHTPSANGMLSRFAAPLGVGGTFTQADIDAGQIKYTPNLNYNGLNDGFFFTVSDGVVTLPAAQFKILVAAVNDKPTATSAVIMTNEDTTSAGAIPNVADVDIATNGDTHTFSIVTQPGHGTANIVTNQLIYTSSLNFYGLDAFIFRATDTGGLSVAGTANVTVNPVNDPPAPTAPAINTTLGRRATSQVIHHDPDAGDTQAYSMTTVATHGAATVNATGLATYTPNPGFIGNDIFTVTVTDSAGATGVVTINVTVTMPTISAVGLSLNNSAFNSTTNNMMILNATTVASIPATHADVYVALQLPDGTLLVMQPDGSFSTAMTPLVANVSVPDFTGPIFNYTFTGAEPPGNYTWFAALTTPGTLNIIGTLSTASFTFAP